VSDYDKKKEKWLKVEKELVAGACTSTISSFCLEVIPPAIASCALQFSSEYQTPGREEFICLKKLGSTAL
jgi:hypothetical protein